MKESGCAGVRVRSGGYSRTDPNSQNYLPELRLQSRAQWRVGLDQEGNPRRTYRPRMGWERVSWASFPGSRSRGLERVLGGAREAVAGGLRRWTRKRSPGYDKLTKLTTSPQARLCRSSRTLPTATAFRGRGPTASVECAGPRDDPGQPFHPSPRTYR